MPGDCELYGGGEVIQFLRKLLLGDIEARLLNAEAAIQGMIVKKPKNHLNQAIADHMRELKKAGWSISAIAEKYGIGESLVKNVIYEISWRRK